MFFLSRKFPDRESQLHHLDVIMRNDVKNQTLNGRGKFCPLQKTVFLRTKSILGIWSVEGYLIPVLPQSKRVCSGMVW